MAYVSELFDQLRDLLNDPTDTQVAYATKKLYLNRGIARLWPLVWRMTMFADITVVADTYDYTLTVPWTGASDYLVVAVELLETDGTRRRYAEYDIVPGDEDLTGMFRFTSVLPAAGSTIKLRVAAQIPTIAAASYAAAESESWSGPDTAMGLPALYAMGMITAAKIDDRQNTLRYSTTQATNGVTDGDLMMTSQMWFGLFEEQLLSLARPLPVARD